jgi:hypothetical protein
MATNDKNIITTTKRVLVAISLVASIDMVPAIEITLPHRQYGGPTLDRDPFYGRD